MNSLIKHLDDLNISYIPYEQFIDNNFTRKVAHWIKYCSIISDLPNDLKGWYEILSTTFNRCKITDNRPVYPEYYSDLNGYYYVNLDDLLQRLFDNQVLVITNGLIRVSLQTKFDHNPSIKKTIPDYFVPVI